MKTRLATLIIAAATAAASLGAETPIALDIARRNASLSFTFTECCDYAVRATIRENGDDFSCAGWEVNLVFGAGDRGVVHEGVVQNVNEVRFNIPASSLPTNGKYTVQIMAMKSGRSSEWGRGTLRMNANPGMEYMPTCWMGYQKVARLAASLLSQDFVTNEVYAAVLSNLSVRVDYSSWTNCCIKITKSKVDGIKPPMPFCWDGVRGSSRVFRSHSLTNACFTLPLNCAIGTSQFTLGGELFLPEKLDDGKWWYRSTSDSARKFMVRLSFVSDKRRSKCLNGE